MQKSISRKLRKAMAIFSAAAVLLSCFTSAISVFAETAGSYNGKAFGFYTHSASPSLSVNTERNSGSLVAGIQTNVYSIKAASAAINPETYDDSDKNYSYVSQFEFTEGTTTADDIAAYSATKWSTDGGLLFYVKLPATIGATNLYLETQTVDAEKDTNDKYKTFHGLEKSKSAYLLAADSLEWETVTTVRFDSGNKKTGGAVSLPQGFEGWVRVPMSSFNKAAEARNGFFRIDFYFNNYSVTDYIKYGGITVIDNAAENFTDITLGDTVYSITDYAAYSATALSPETFSGNDEYTLEANGTSNAQTAGLFGSGTSFISKVTATEDTEKTYCDTEYYKADFVPQVRPGGGHAINEDKTWATATRIQNVNVAEFAPTSYSMYKYTVGSNDDNITDGVYTEPNDESYCARIDFKTNDNSDYHQLNWNSGNSLIFYVESTGTVANRISLTANDSKISAHLYENMNYYLLSAGSAEWKQGTTLDVHGNGRGYIELPAGFKGWVRIACDSFLNNNNVSVTGKSLKNVKVFFEHLGGNYGTISIGEFGMVETEESRSYIASSFNDNQPVRMTSDAYSVKAAGGISAEQRPTNDRVIKAVADKTELSVTLSVNTELTSDYVTDGVFSHTTPIKSDYYGIIKFSDAPFLSKNGSIVMYVDHSDSTADVSVAIGLNDEKFYIAESGRPYYLFADGAASWTEYTPEKLENGQTKAAIVIPAGFKGLLRIPASSLRRGTTYEYVDYESTVTALNIYPTNLGGDYGTLKFSKIQVTAENDSRYYFENNGSYTDLSGAAVSANLFKKAVISKVTVAEGSVTSTPTALTADITDSVLNRNSGIMFYAKTETAAGIKLALSAENTLKTEFSYSYISSGGIWQTAQSENGVISLSAGFEGWVRLSAEAFVSSEIELIGVGFEATAVGAELSDFMLVTLAENDLDYIMVNGTKTSLFVSLYDANADGEINLLDLVRIKKYTANISGVKVAEIAADIDGVNGVNATDLTLLRKRLINGEETGVSEFSVSRLMAQSGYTTVAGYDGTATAETTVNF